MVWIYAEHENLLIKVALEVKTNPSISKTMRFFSLNSIAKVMDIKTLILYKYYWITENRKYETASNVSKKLMSLIVVPIFSSFIAVVNFINCCFHVPPNNLNSNFLYNYLRWFSKKIALVKNFIACCAFPCKSKLYLFGLPVTMSNKTGNTFNYHSIASHSDKIVNFFVNFFSWNLLCWYLKGEGQLNEFMKN